MPAANNIDSQPNNLNYTFAFLPPILRRPNELIAIAMTAKSNRLTSIKKGDNR